MGRDPFGGAGDERDDLGGPGRLVLEQLRVAETAVPVATLGVEDPELGASPGWPVSAPGNECLGSLANDVTTEPDPAPPTELQPESRRLGDGGGEPGSQSRRLESDEEGLCPSSQRREPTESRGDLRGRRPRVRTWREIDHENVDGAAGEEHPGDREPLVERFGSQDDEPVEANAPSSRLDGIQRPREIQPGDDCAVGHVGSS